MFEQSFLFHPDLWVITSSPKQVAELLDILRALPGGVDKAGWRSQADAMRRLRQGKKSELWGAKTRAAYQA